MFTNKYNRIFHELNHARTLITLIEESKQALLLVFMQFFNRIQVIIQILTQFKIVLKKL